ncbi:HU family DNA-binding protein [Nocardioides sp. P5_C9_2]
MNKSQLIDALAARYEGNRKQAAHALDSVLDTITREVAKGEKVAITGFGSFEKTVRNARWVRNPQTGERMKSKKKSVPKFSPGQDLKNIVSGAKKLPKLTAATMPKPPSVRTVAAVATGTVTAAAKRATPGSRSTASKSTPARSTAKKAPATKAPATKSTAKKAPAKKATTKATTTKATSSATTAKKAPAKKAASTTASKTTASKTTATKTTASKAAASKSTAAKKAPAKKTTTAKKTTAKKS